MLLPEIVDLQLYIVLCLDYLSLYPIYLRLQNLKRIAFIERLIMAHPSDKLAQHQVFWVDKVRTLYFRSFLLTGWSICILQPVSCLRLRFIRDNYSAEHKEVDLVSFGYSLLRLLTFGSNYLLFLLNDLIC